MSQYRYDVTVVGGGTTGACAALAAAREGAKVAIVESEGFLGGNAANGLPWLGFHHPDSGEQVVGGIPFELVQELQSLNGATQLEPDPICGSAVGVNSVMLKMLLSKKMKEAGVTTHLHTFAHSAVKRDDGQWELTVYNAQGRQEILSEILIDCTDSGSVATSAGAESWLGREVDHEVQVASAVVRFGNIHVDELIRYFRENPMQMRPFKIDTEALERHLGLLDQREIFVIGAFPELIAKAKADGLRYYRDRLIGVVNAKAKEMILVCSRNTGVDPKNNRVYSDAENDAIQQTEDIWKLLREYLPGCSEAYPVASGHTLGLRETYHITGDYQLTASDLLSAKWFEDGIAMGGYHLDIHSPDHNGLNSQFSPVYAVPYRCMLPVGVDDMLVAGRCVSATQEAQASIRVIPICGAMGEAAGAAAGIAIAENCRVRDVSVKTLREKLRKHNALIP